MAPEIVYLPERSALLVIYPNFPDVEANKKAAYVNT